ncbi:MAG: sialate O-acetylesterase [Phycisphaera sp.]|nr:sialate O-acetylesterase [Phycisphaera sp.]
MLFSSVFRGSRAFFAALTVCVITLLLNVSPGHAADKPVKVFILAGQSNMEGKSRNDLWNYQGQDAKTKDFFAHLRDGDKWVERDDVFIKFLDRHGNLTLGYGSPGATGAEYEFGYMLGEHFDEPVLLIKAAWGGHSLYQKFRSPSNPITKDRLDEELAKQIENTRKKNENMAKQDADKPENKRRKPAPLPTMQDIEPQYGVSYRNMMAEVEDVKANYATLFPQLKGRPLEFAGFFWFQGFNDQFGDYAPDEYKQNMEMFIKDVRKDLGVPKLPFVIAAIGTFAEKPEVAETHKVYQAQMAMNAVPEFKGNVKAFATHPLVDKAAMELYPHWKDNFEHWKLTGSDRAYHYFGSAIWYTRIGHAAGEAMIELVDHK